MSWPTSRTARRVDGRSSPERPPGHIAGLDGLRAIAVVLVMFFHAGIPGFSGGKAGVDVFFVLSGFLITSLLLKEHERNGKIQLRAFYMRRSLRLLPALLVAIAVALILAAAKIPIFGSSSDSLRSTALATPFVLLYTINLVRAFGWSEGGFLGHTWSLAIEEQFYLVWPMLSIWVLRGRVRRETLGWIAFGFAVASATSRAVLDVWGVRSEALYNFTLTHVDGIFAGCAIAVLAACRPNAMKRIANQPACLLLIGCSAIVIVRGEGMNVYGFVIVVLTTISLLAIVVSRPDHWPTQALSNPALVWVGRRSYGLYLYHWPIFLFVGIDTRPHILAIAFVGSFVAAWLSFALIERPILRRKERWSVQSSSAAEPVRTSTAATG